jgi:hypothetical protein
MNSKTAKIALIIGLILVGLVQAIAIDKFSTRNIIIVICTWILIGVVISGLVFNILWALRILALIVFAGCFYLLAVTIFDKPLLPVPKSISPIIGAYRYMFLFGMPSIIFVIKGDKWFGKRFRNKEDGKRT